VRISGNEEEEEEKKYIFCGLVMKK